MTATRRFRSSTRDPGDGDSDTTLGLVGLLALAAIALFVVYWDEWEREVLADLPPQPWVSRLPSEWPRLVLTNQVRVRGYEEIEGGAAYLAELGDGHLLGVSARGVLDELGDKAARRPDRFNVLLDSWTLGPADSAAREGAPARVDCVRLSARVRPLSDSEVVLADTETRDAPPPALALRIFTGRVRAGERVFVAVPAAEEANGQSILHGKVLVATPGGERLDVRLEEKVHADGFEGSPLLNAKGYAIGVVTGTFPFAEDEEGKTYVLVCEGLRPLRNRLD